MAETHTRTPIVATLTGIVDLLNPDPATISARAMAHHLAQQNRYAGALELPISVAQHSILVLEIFKRRFPALPGIYALLDDAQEYVWGDLIRPAQEAYESCFPGFRRVREGLHTRMNIAIRAHFGLPDPTIEICAAVHEADKIAFATEWARFMPVAAGPCPIDATPLRSISLKPLPWVAASDAFLEALHLEMDQFRRNQAEAIDG